MKPVLSKNLFVRTTRIAAFLFACTATAHAQSTKSAMSPKKFQGVEIGTGFFRGVGAGPRDNEVGLSYIVQGKLQLAGSDRHRVLGLLNMSGFLIPDMTDDCAVIPYSDDTFSGCLPNFPSGVSLGALGGMENRINRALAVGLYAGPAVFLLNHEPDRLGLQTRADITVPANQHAAFVVWGQFAYIPMGRGIERGLMPMGGIGIRFR